MAARNPAGLRSALTYNAEEDFARSIELCYQLIRERRASGGKGWMPMSFTIIDDNGVLEIRASVKTPEELGELIEKLQKRQQAWDSPEAGQNQSKET